MMMTGTPGWSKLQIDILSKMWSEGYSCAVIGERIGKSRDAVIGKRLRLGLPNRGNNNRPITTIRVVNDNHEMIVKLRCEPFNWTAAAIAQALGEKPKVVHNVINQYTERS